MSFPPEVGLMLTNSKTPIFIRKDIKVILFPISSSVMNCLANHSVLFVTTFYVPIAYRRDTRKNFEKEETFSLSDVNHLN